MLMEHTFLMTIQRIEGYDKIIFRAWWALPVLGAMILIWIAWRIMVALVLWLKKPRCKPSQLFKKLCRAHRLSSIEIELLKSQRLGMTNNVDCIILFVDPSTWQWKHGSEEKTLESLEKLYTKIFGFPPENVSS